jgi:hypothetical protein
MTVNCRSAECLLMGLSVQSVDATPALKIRSARVSKVKTCCQATRLSCECAPPAVPQLLLGHRVEPSNISSRPVEAANVCVWHEAGMAITLSVSAIGGKADQLSCRLRELGPVSRAHSKQFGLKQHQSR